jgi:hypothetical protein
MPRPRETAWFAAKPPGMGWGWGLPLRWQGWVVLGVYLGLALLGPFVLVWIGEESPAFWPAFAAYMAGFLLFSVGFIWLCWIFGEDPNGPA